MTEVIQVDPGQPDRAAIARAAQVLRGGGLVAFPTETVYGLGVHALDRAAVRRLFEAKRRPASDPLIVHVGSIDALAGLVTGVPDSARTLARRFWPGPLTLVLPRSPAVPDEVTAGLPTVAVRVPAHPVARALLDAAGIPVAAPSANLFSRPSPTDAAHVLDDLDGRIDLVLDGGSTTIGVESTVLDLTQPTPIVLRPGAITIEMLQAILPDVRSAGASAPATARGTGSAPAATTPPMPSPGMLEKHYSPRAPLTLYEGTRAATLSAIETAAREYLASGKVVGLLASSDDRDALAALVESDRRVLLCTLGSEDKPDEAAARLYAAMRELDAAGASVILVRGFTSDTGLGVAVNDRLRRAAGRIVRC